MLKARFGRLAIFWAGIRRLSEGPLNQQIVRIGEDEYRASIAIVAKGRYYAGGFVAAPEASIFDPDLHVALLPGLGFLSVLRYVLAFFCGVLPRLPEVAIHKCREVSIGATAPGPVQADGEIVGWLPVVIRVAEKPLILVGP
jgi:diacylglycerol kinase family enzyme